MHDMCGMHNVKGPGQKSLALWVPLGDPRPGYSQAAGHLAARPGHRPGYRPGRWTRARSAGYSQGPAGPLCNQATGPAISQASGPGRGYPVAPA